MSLLQTALYQKHVDLKAKLAPFAGYDMPLQYSSVKEEVKAVRENCGVFDVSHMCEFMVEGPEAAKFVDYIMTNDFFNATDLKAVYSPMCNEEGKVLDDLIAYKFNNQKVLICANASNHQKDWDWISSKVSGFNASIADISKETSLLAIQGPKTEEILKSIGFSNFESTPYYGLCESSFDGNEVLLARTGYTGEDGFEIFCSHESASKIWDELMKKNVLPCGLASRDVLRIEVAYPLYGQEISEDLSPLDAALKWTVKFDKTDFIGKSALENTTPSNRLIKLSIDKGIPRPKYPVCNESGEEIGYVSSGTHSVSTEKGIALCLIKKDLFPENKKFTINIRGKLIPANYQTKAFVSGSHK